MYLYFIEIQTLAALTVKMKAVHYFMHKVLHRNKSVNMYKNYLHICKLNV
jgi:hypothetical protein